MWLVVVLLCLKGLYSKSLPPNLAVYPMCLNTEMGPTIDCEGCRNRLRRRNRPVAIDCDAATVPSQSFTITGPIAASQWSCDAPVMHYRS